MERKFVLTGPLEGQTIALGSSGQYQFEDGVMAVVGSPEDVEKVGLYVGRCWQAYPEGTEELKRAQSGNLEDEGAPAKGSDTSVQSGVSTGDSSVQADSSQLSEHDEAKDGPRGSDSDGSGSGELGDLIRKALAMLDPKDDEVWNRDGSPKVHAVASILDNDNIGKMEVVEALPGFNRDVAREEKS